MAAIDITTLFCINFYSIHATRTRQAKSNKLPKFEQKTHKEEIKDQLNEPEDTRSMCGGTMGCSSWVSSLTFPVCSTSPRRDSKHGKQPISREIRSKIKGRGRTPKDGIFPVRRP